MKKNKEREKKYDIKKIIEKRGGYRPLCFHENGEDFKFDYNLDEYCRVLVDKAKLSTSASTKAELLADISTFILNLGYRAETDEEAEKEKEARRQLMQRYNKRLINGMEHEVDGKKIYSVASDRSCYHFLEDVEKCLKISLLTPINDKIPYFYENKYIFMLISQLVKDMYTSDIFNYVPYSNNYQYKCYTNHLNMIEQNIKEVFAQSPELQVKWEEIIRPLQELIYDCNYPGFREGDIWTQKCDELRFFDCSYVIAKDFELYSKVKGMLKFDLGSTREEVAYEIEACKSFFNKNKQNEKKLFCDEMLCTLKKIVYEEFGLEVDYH